MKVAAPDGDLIARSREMAAAIPGYDPGNGVKAQCLVATGPLAGEVPRLAACSFMECVEHAAADAPRNERPVSALYAGHALGLVRLAVIMLGDQASAG